MKLLRNRILDPTQRVLFYELIPPSQGAKKKSVNAYAECAAEMIAGTTIPIDAVNLPEIQDEQRDSERVHEFKEKADPRKFGQRLTESFHRPLELIVNRCTVAQPVEAQKKWLQETHEKFGIEYVILVGGESSQQKYPGPSVPGMARLAREYNAEAFTCGGITIPTRRREDPSRDEPNRLLEKGRQGIDFFTSQVLYEPESTRKLLRDYQDLCDKKGETPKRIFLSFAPVASRKDLKFLKWLGVEVPQPIEETLLKTNLGIGWRSVQVARQILSDILEFASREDIRVPLGLNIEHITLRNFELSRDFIEELGAIYYQKQGNGRLPYNGTNGNGKSGRIPTEEPAKH